MTKHFLRAALGAAAVVGLGMGASGALADGYYVGSVKDTAPIPAPVAYEWNGFSVGAGIGVGRFEQDVFGGARRTDDYKYKKCKSYNHWWCTSWWDWTDASPDPLGLSSGSSSDDWSFFGTAQLGYDRLLGDRFLIGAFADFDFFKDSDTSFSRSDRDGNSLKGNVQRDHAWTVGGRLGYLVSPRILLYGLAGYSQMKLEGTLDAHFPDPLFMGMGPDSNPSAKVSDWVDGWTVGAGIEAKLEKRLSLKLEYRYSTFDGASASNSSNHGPEEWKDFYQWKHEHSYSEGARLDLGDTDIHSVRAVLSFKLGRDEEPIAPLK